LHGVFIHAFQLQVTVLFIPFQHALAFKISGYAVAYCMDEYGQFFLNRSPDVSEACLALFIFCVDAI
jgi:hypothetical protein